jgi:hypothetical protein
MYGDIYLATDLTNGKSYCGQETQGPFSRMKNHLKKSSRKTHFHHALTLRPEAFFWQIIECCDSKEELDAAEVRWGLYFDCLWPNGYSLKLGMARGKASAETRMKQSMSLKGHAVPLAARLKMSQSHKGMIPVNAWKPGNPTWNKGIPSPLRGIPTGIPAWNKGMKQGPLSAEHRAKISASKMGNRKGVAALMRYHLKRRMKKFAMGTCLEGLI